MALATTALGRFIAWAELAKASANGEAIMVVLYKNAGLPTDAALANCKYLSDVNAIATETDFTYTAGPRRKVFSGNDLYITDDLTNKKSLFGLTQQYQIWEAAGGVSGGSAVNNDVGMVGFFYRERATGTQSADNAIRAISMHRYFASTNGQDFRIAVPIVTSDQAA